MQITAPTPFFLPNPKILIPLLIFIVFLFSIIYFFSTTSIQISQTYQYALRGSSHAFTKHGEGSLSGYDCFEEHGSSRSFITTDNNNKRVRTWLCFDGFDWFSLITTPFEKDSSWGSVANVETGFKVTNHIEDYINTLYLNRNAVEIMEYLPAHELILIP